MLLMVPGLSWAQHHAAVNRLDNCIDLTDLNAPYIHCTYGSFSNPYANDGIAPDRHSVITQQAIDPITYSSTDAPFLYKIPPGETYSIKLGNSLCNKEAESIAVDITVDTNLFDLLVLKYAAILQSPTHTHQNQPRFKFETLNSFGHSINPSCLSANFVANESLGWDSVEYHGCTVLWKDWTSVGFDMSDFHGQTIRVRLTTYDCSFGNHFGYAYFLLSCNRKRIAVKECGYVDWYLYSAPSGFNYEWFWQDDPDHVISQDQTVRVPTGGSRELGCHVSFIENPSCGFDLYTDTERRFPLSGCSVAEDSCPYEIHFLNESLISNDGIHPDGTGRPCEDVFWDFGDGQSSYDFSPTHTYTLSGDFTVTMVAGLNDFECTDTSFLEVHIPEYTLIDTVTCEPFSWAGEVYWESGVYHRNFTTTSGCDSLATLRLDANYPPDFSLRGDRWPIGGTELAWTQYTYDLAFDNPYCMVDSIEWHVDCPTMLVLPSDDGLSCELRIFSFLPSNDSVPLRAVAHNRCGTEERTLWIHTSYYGIDDHALAPAVLEVFPNPASGVLNIRMRGLVGETRMELYDGRGTPVDKWARHNKSGDETMIYDASRLPEGLYLLRVSCGRRSVATKILVRR